MFSFACLCLLSCSLYRLMQRISCVSLNVTYYLNCRGHWGTTDDFTTSFLHFLCSSLPSGNLANSSPVHSPLLSSHLFFCLPCLLPHFTVPCKMILARPDERETFPYHFCLRLYKMVRSSCGPIDCWILTRLPRW